MFLSYNDNYAPWFKMFCRAHVLAPKHVINPHCFDDLIRANDNTKPLRVWIPETVCQCATTLETVACSHISSQPLYERGI